MILTALLAFAPVLSPQALPQNTEELPYEQVAGEFLADHDLTGKAPAEVDLEAVLRRDFVRADVGLFEVLIPAVDLESKETATDFRDVCEALFESQGLWLGWLGDQAVDGKALAKDLEQGEKWAKSWKPGVLQKVADGEARDVRALFEPKGPVAEALDRSAAALRSRAPVGQSAETPRAVRLVLIPHREQFVEFLAFAGWLREDMRPTFWVPGIQTWSEFRLDELQVIALEYASLSQMNGEYASSTSMKDIETTGLEEQVVQLASNKLLAYEHGDAMPGGLISGLSLNLVIQQYGACHTRIDGDTRSRFTQKREIFVAGGRSEGGNLPKNVAESRWRQDYGKYHFVRVLGQVQKSGASADKRNKNQLNSFLLMADDGKMRDVAHAPLLGEGEDPNAELPDGAGPDFSELLRAYKSAFLFWLQTEAMSSKKDSAAAYGRLLTQIAVGGEGGGFSTVVREVYGLPLSDPEVGGDCLEGRFLRWLSRQ
ncbi:MAG: hypothetical protein H6828_12965 [Planctomycetes bacterium]|nr:hypothetical protein [Planctomycetota bacterium]